MPTQSRPRPLLGRQLQQPQVQVQPLHRQVQSLKGLLPMQLLCLLELQLQCVHNQEAQSRRLIHKVEENKRRQALRESRKAWVEASFNHPIIREGNALACQCEPRTFQPNCRVQNTCPTTGRPVRLHFALGANHSIACMIYFATEDKVYLDMYAISGDEWKHDSGDESDSSLSLF